VVTPLVLGENEERGKLIHPVVDSCCASCADAVVSPASGEG